MNVTTRDADILTHIIDTSLLMISDYNEDNSVYLLTFNGLSLNAISLAMFIAHKYNPFKTYVLSCIKSREFKVLLYMTTLINHLIETYSLEVSNTSHLFFVQDIIDEIIELAGYDKIKNAINNYNRDITFKLLC